jgi:uncharacterized repeat protein (TIGR01451 family)
MKNLAGLRNSLSVFGARRVLLRSGMWILSGTCALLLGASGSPLSAKPQSGWTRLVSAGSHSFVLFQDERGEIICREATDAENREIGDRKGGGSARVIYSGAPLRSQMRDGSQTWSPDQATTLSLLPSAGLHIVLHGTAQLDENQTAKNAFIVAANRWEAIISTPITVVIDVDFGSTFFGQPYSSSNILGETGLSVLSGPYTDLRQRLIDNASTSVEQQLYAALPATAVPVDFNGVLSDVSSVSLAEANGRALGIVPDIADPNSVALGQGDAGIGFNSAFQFDLNPDDGISPTLTDFDSVVTHEIGHALGFISESGGSSAAPVSVWDLFRFAPASASLATFATARRIMSKGATQIFFANQLSTFGTLELGLSTGGPNPGPSDGDGRQSSHWKDDALLSTRPYIGIMDPSLAPGLRRTISENDIRAIDLLGYSIGAPPPLRPPNDNFVDALGLQTNSGSLTGSNANGTREPGEPLHVGYLGDKSVWYSWVPTVNGQATFDTAGSNFDTTLAVYTGPSVNQLGNLAQSDDVSNSDKTSRVQFNVTAGTTYRIVVDGWNGEFGSITLNWTANGTVPTPTPTPGPTPSPSPTPTPTPTPTADLAIDSFVATPNPVARTQYVNFTVSARNLGPGPAGNTTVAVQLPAGTTFAFCTPVCNGPNTSDGGTATAILGTVASGASISFVVSAQVTAVSGSVLSATGSISSSSQDPNNGNNSRVATTSVVDAVPFAEAKAISLNTEGAHVLVLRGGTVWAWGHNFYGELGDGTTTNRSVPRQVEDLTFVKAIGAGSNFSVALKQDGTVWTWGTNEDGQLGTGSATPPQVSRPVQVTGLTSVVAISVGTEHTLALKSDGTLWAWGWNPTGALGLGSQDFGPHPTPTQVPGLSGIVKIFAGDGLSYAINGDGTIWGWGFGYGGQLGDGQTGIVTTSPLQLPALKGAISIGSGAAATVVVKNDQTVWSFGFNGAGRLGRGISDNNTYPVPAQIPSLLATSVSGGYAHYVVTDAGGTIKTFGANDTGQMGSGTNDILPHSTPIAVPGIANVFATAAGGGATLALLGDANSGGTIRSWGKNDFGQLGLGSNSPAYSPATVLEELIAAKPIFSMPAGSYNSGTLVYVVSGTPGAVVHYTLTGQDPTEADPIAAPGVPFYLDHSLTFKARAWRAGFAASTISSATYTIGIPVNTIDDSRNFVIQQYRDFLNRDPDPSGLNFWTNEITSCGNDQQCIALRRINVSASFFLSIEFQGTGYLVERLYKTAFGNTNGASTFGGIHSLAVPIVRRSEFLPDTQQIGQNLIVGNPGWETVLENNKQAFSAEFVQRARFTSAFPSSMTAELFVDTLNTNAGNPLSQSERDQLVNDLATNGKTRAQVLRAVAEDPDLNSAEFNRAFVLMQYFGYLRRNPNDPQDTDYTGYDFWLTKLNQFNGNFVNAEMVKAFISSSEYRQRFGP